MSDQKKYRVLSLDGGGSWATIQVAALSRLYSPDTRGHEVLKDFHHVAANSGGSIVLAGLLLNASLRELQEMFGDIAVREALFTPLSSFEGGVIFSAIRRCVGFPRFYTAKKRDELNRLFTHLMQVNHIDSLELNALASGIRDDFHFTIVSYDYRRDRAKYFRSNTNSAAGSGSAAASTANLVDAVHAASTAPVQFFDRPAESPNPSLQGELFWDGAITGQNNPIVAGVIETLASGAAREDVVVLSLGTGNNSIPPSLAKNPPWALTDRVSQLKEDVKKLAKAVVGDPPDHASFVAHMLLSRTLPLAGDSRPFTNSPIVRMNPLIAPMPNPDGNPNGWIWPLGLRTPEQQKIIDLDMAAVTHSDFAMVEQLTVDWIAGRIRNQPIRMGSDLACDMGDETFSNAMARWNQIRN